MEVRTTRSEMVQRFDLRKSQAAMQVRAGETDTPHTDPTAHTDDATVTRPGAVGSARWYTEPGSRTAQLLRGVSCASEATHTTLTAPAQHDAFCLLLLELRRAEAFVELFQTTLTRLVHAHRCEGVLTAMERKELPARWVLQGLNELPSALPETRSRVTLLDVGATVRLLPAPSSSPTETTTSRKHPRDDGPHASTSPAQESVINTEDEVRAGAVTETAPIATFEVVRTASMSHGQYWVELRAVGASSSSSSSASLAEATQKVDCAAVCLCPPAPLYVDALIPCDEACSPRGTSTCLFLSLLLGAQRRRAAHKFEDAFQNRASGPLSEPDVAGLTVAMSQALARARRTLWCLRRDLMTPALTQQGTTCAVAATSATLSSTPTSLTAEMPMTTTTTDSVCPVDTRARRLEVWLESGDALRLVLFPPCESLETAAPATFDGVHSVTLLVRTVQKLARGYDSTRCARVNSASAASTSMADWLDAVLATRAVTDKDNNKDPQHEADGDASSCLLHSMVATRHSESESDHSEADASVSLFLVRLFTMAYRYRTLQGDEGYNGGPHAAVPPTVLESLRASFSVTVEAFASPLNHHFPLFGSLFADTDVFFGSIGSFFDLRLISGHVEVNPPFDTAVLERTQRALFDSLAQSDRPPREAMNAPPRHKAESHSTDASLRTDDVSPSPAAESLLFVVVLPSHDLDPLERRDDEEGGEDAHRPIARTRARTVATATTKTKLSADRAMRESRYCLAHTLCAASESAYVDGQQHLLRAPLFCIRSPTRLIVLGNEAARRRYPDAAQRLEAVRQGWQRMTSDALSPEYAVPTD